MDKILLLIFTVYCNGNGMYVFKTHAKELGFEDGQVLTSIHECREAYRYHDEYGLDRLQRQHEQHMKRKM